MNLGLTVKELYAACLEQMEKGNGDKHIIISDDDEANGFHTLFYQFVDEKEELKEFLRYEHDGTHTVDNCVCLG